jgi:hypothetical protein
MSNKTSISKKIRFGFICVTILISFFFGATNSASAQVEAQATIRYVASGGPDIGDCSSSASPCGTIQYAVNQSVSGDWILVAQGTYTYNAGTDPCTFFQTRAVVCVYGKNLTILGGYSTGDWSTANPTGNLTVIDGGNTYRGVIVNGFNTAPTNLDMEGFTIQNGRAQGPLYPGVPGGRGGGMWVNTAATTLKDVVFKNNRSIGDNYPAAGGGAGGSADGSGLSIDASPAGTSSLLQRVTFDSNQSLGGVGSIRGGVAFGALFVYASTVTIEDSTFTNNFARAGSSTGSGFSGGLAADALGGAIAFEQGSATLNRIVVTGNQAIGGNAATSAGGSFGAGIYTEDSSSVSISDSIVNGNVSQAGNAVNGGYGSAGGILIYNGPATINRVKVVANRAIGGSTTGGGSAGSAGAGGIYLWRTNSSVNGNSSVTNTIITDNYVGTGSGTVPGGGGGGVQAQGVTATFIHCTIARNQLGSSLISGQGLLVLAAPSVSSSTVAVSFSVISDHTVGASAYAVLVQSGNILNFNRSLFANNTHDTNGSITWLSPKINTASAGYISSGSPNYNYHIRPDSAAKDQATGSTTAQDIDLQSRPYNGVSDLGADEYSPFPLVVRSGDGTLRLDWAVGASWLAGGVDHYEMIVTCAAGANAPDQVGCGSSINVGTATTITLTGLTDFKGYTSVVNAYDSSRNLIGTSTTVTAFPTNIFLYLPLVMK